MRNLIRSIPVGLVLLGLLGAQDGLLPPKGISPFMWAREDVVAGPMANDIARFELGARKVDAMIQQNPSDIAALSLKGYVELFQAVRTFEGGKSADAVTRYRGAMQQMERAAMINRSDLGLLATSAAGLMGMADRLPPEIRTEALKKGLEVVVALITPQEQGIEKLPKHFTGELLSLRAYGELRAGDPEVGRKYLTKIVATMPRTPYASRATKWLENPNSANSPYMCLTCHEPGRLVKIPPPTKGGPQPQ